MASFGGRVYQSRFDAILAHPVVQQVRRKAAELYENIEGIQVFNTENGSFGLGSAVTAPFRRSNDMAEDGGYRNMADTTTNTMGNIGVNTSRPSVNAPISRRSSAASSRKASRSSSFHEPGICSDRFTNRKRSSGSSIGLLREQPENTAVVRFYTMLFIPVFSLILMFILCMFLFPSLDKVHTEHRKRVNEIHSSHAGSSVDASNIIGSNISSKPTQSATGVSDAIDSAASTSTVPVASAASKVIARVYVIRHGEKTFGSTSQDLSPAGWRRARYIAEKANHLFRLNRDSRIALYARTDKDIHREVETLLPLSTALQIEINKEFDIGQETSLVQDVEQHIAGAGDPGADNDNTFILSWEHCNMALLLQAFGCRSEDCKTCWQDAEFDQYYELDFGFNTQGKPMLLNIKKKNQGFGNPPASDFIGTYRGKMQYQCEREAVARKTSLKRMYQCEL